MRNIKDLSETPIGILKKLYSLRLRTDRAVPFEEYVDRYRFISVKERTMGDETAYAAGMRHGGKNVGRRGTVLRRSLFLTPSYTMAL